MYRGVPWLIIDNDWLSGHMVLGRADGEGNLFWKTVHYGDIDKVLAVKSSRQAYDSVGLGSFQRNPERHGYRFGGPLEADSKLVPPDVLRNNPDCVVAKLLVSEVIQQ